MVKMPASTSKVVSALEEEQHAGSTQICCGICANGRRDARAQGQLLWAPHVVSGIC